MLREEAEKERDQINATVKIREDLFCPLLKGNCVTNCVCFNKAYLGKTANDIYSFVVHPGYCSNYMFIGPS